MLSSQNYPQGKTMPITRERISEDYYKPLETCRETRTRISPDYYGSQTCGSSWPSFGRSNWGYSTPSPFYTAPPVYHPAATHVYSDSIAGGVLLTAFAVTALAILLIPASTAPRCWNEEVCDPFNICHMERVCHTLF